MRDRRPLVALVPADPTPEASGSHDREQGLGISVEMAEIVTDARLTLGGSE